ncbi:hypothetical protein Droror1_Dr00024971 [Drosera rotundifolia]
MNSTLVTAESTNVRAKDTEEVNQRDNDEILKSKEGKHAEISKMTVDIPKEKKTGFDSDAKLKGERLSNVDESSKRKKIAKADEQRDFLIDSKIKKARDKLKKTKLFEDLELLKDTIARARRLIKGGRKVEETENKERILTAWKLLLFSFICSTAHPSSHTIASFSKPPSTPFRTHSHLPLHKPAASSLATTDAAIIFSQFCQPRRPAAEARATLLSSAKLSHKSDVALPREGTTLRATFNGHRSTTGCRRSTSPVMCLAPAAATTTDSGVNSESTNLDSRGG